MNGTSIAYAQVRMQSRYGQRADPGVWLKLHNIRDLGSYLQTAQQTPLRQWVLGISPTHSSHDIELTLRQKYRHHVNEVAGWMPQPWQKPLRWTKRLVDLPVLQYLSAGGESLAWMRSDTDLKDFTTGDAAAQRQAMREAGLDELVDAFEQDGSMLPGWIKQWNRLRPGSFRSDRGLDELERLIREQLQQLMQQQGPAQPTDYDLLLDRLRLMFRRHAFKPAAACAYLAIAAVDLQRVRGDLVQRVHFAPHPEITEGLPA